MPAEAELLCDYFLSSKLSSKKKSVEPISATAVLLKQQKLSTGSFTTNELNFDSIEFVKYEKNPMDYLKSKYTLLNGTSTSTDTPPATKQTLKLQPTEAPEPAATAAAVKKKTAESTLIMNWSKLKRNGIGLLNIGNNCYLNATLQCLAYTAPLSQWLLARPHSTACCLKRQKGFCSMCDVERIICDIFSANGCAKPNSLCMNIRKISTVFGVGRQEDASEFFTTLLESMSKAMSLQNGHSKQQKADANSHAKRPTTILDEIFSFQFRSRVTCCSCGRVSDTIEHNNTWPVDVKHNNDIRKGMIQFMREDILDGHNAYKCNNCHKKTRATKKYSIRKSPNVLVVHLKRFDFSVNGKLSHHVAYPELLNLKNLSQTPTSSSVPTPAAIDCDDKKSTKPSVYKLYGVLVHLGHTSRSGHYYSYVKGPSDTWFRADDSRVNKVQASEALNQKAYMLFYKRVVPELAEDQRKLNGHATENGRPKFDINAKSPFKVNGNIAEIPAINAVKNPVAAVNGERLERGAVVQQPVGNNILNDLLTSSMNGVVKATKTNGYSYSRPAEVNGTNGFHAENGKKEEEKVGEAEMNGHKNGNHEKKEKMTKKQKIRRLTERIVKLKQSSKESKKKPLKLKKLIRRRKALRKIVKAKSLVKNNKATPDESEVSSVKATKPEFSTVLASLDEPLKIEKATSFADSEKTGNVLKALKAAAATSTLLTWKDQESSLLVKESKKKDQISGVKRQRYDDDLDGIEVDSDEYNEEFDKPQVREKKSKFLLEQKRHENGFHKYTHDLGGRKKFERSNGDRFSSQKGSNRPNMNGSRGGFGGGRGRGGFGGGRGRGGFKGNRGGMQNGKSNFSNRHKPYGH